MAIRRLMYLAGFVFVVAACADANSRESFSVTDSAGVRIVESHGPGWEATRGWGLSPEPTLQIGEREGAEEFQFFNVTDGLRLSDGRIAILNSGTTTIRVFGPEGGFLTEFGGSGDGPEEFRSLSSVHALPGDTLGIWDGRRLNFSLFTPSGDFIRSQRIAPPGSERLANLQPLADGRFLAKTYASPLTEEVERGVGIYRDTAPVFIYGGNGELLDTLGFFPSTESVIMEVAGQSLFGPAPFFKGTWIDVLGNSIYLGTADAMEVFVLDPQGVFEAIFRYPGADLVLRQEDREWFAACMTEMASTPQEQQFLAPLLDAQIFPETRAAFSDLRVDGNGAIWLRTGREFLPLGPSTEWTVFSAGGGLLGTLSLPERFHVLEFGDDYVLGVWKDEMDVEFIRLYSLAR